MEEYVERKWAIVTGGSSGLGLALARRLVGHYGYSVVIVGRSASRLDAAAEQLRALACNYAYRGERPEIMTYPLDLSLSAAPEQLHEWTLSRDIHPSLLVNNAGMYIYEEVTSVSADRQKSIIGLNISALTSLCRLYGADMAQAADSSRRGLFRSEFHILNIASYSVYMKIAGFGLYAGTKSYVRTFSKCLGKELRRHGVDVTAVAPAGMDTNLMKLRPSVQSLARRTGFLASPDLIARISLRVAHNPFIHYWIPLWYNALAIPFLWMFQPLFKKVL